MQRPDLVEAVGLDFFLARKVAAVIVAMSRWPLGFGGRLAVRSDLVAAVDEYATRMFEELDYRREVRTVWSKVLLIFRGNGGLCGQDCVLFVGGCSRRVGKASHIVWKVWPGFMVIRRAFLVQCNALPSHKTVYRLSMDRRSL